MRTTYATICRAAHSSQLTADSKKLSAVGCRLSAPRECR